MPFPFYNTAAPTPSTKNTINSITVSYGIRDYLLNKNLQPTYPFISTNINGSPKIGEPVLDTSINGDSNVTPIGLPLEVEGLTRYNQAIAPNQFKNDDGLAPQLLSIDNVSTTQGVFGNIDFPQGTQSYPIGANSEVNDYGILGKSEYAEFRKKATLYNLYVDSDKQIDVSDYISLAPIGYPQQTKGYLDTYGGLNLGDTTGIQAANIIGSVLNGQGLGLAKGGIVTNYDVRSSLAGRVLGATGLINDTKLGMIGAQQLALSLANNAAFNIEQSILGTLNVSDNVLSVVKNGTTVGLRPNYQITVPSGDFAKVADYTARILGFVLPKSYLSDDGSIFLSESNSANIERANSMILNTGKGQVTALISNVEANINGTGQYDNPSTTPFRSGYVPGYKTNTGGKAINPELYAFYNSDKSTIYNFVVSDPNNIIPKISYNRVKMVSDYGFKSPDEQYFVGHRGGEASYENRTISKVGFSWGSFNSPEGSVNENADYSPLIGDKKSLLVKTQKLFNSKGMKNIVTAKGDMNNNSSQITTANGGGFSKGSAVLAGNLYNSQGILNARADADNTYCRSWTTLDRYDKVSKLVRSRGLDKVYPYRNQTNNSVLDEYGFVKIAPYVTDSPTDPKKFMFSIENLAWNDKVENLMPCEQGPGDLMSGKRGRIMWFPPYDIQFSETSSVNLDTVNFIGRGEPVYTYNNTERTGNLSFKIIVDHQSYVNSFRGSNGPDDHYVASYFAGCVEPSQYFVDKLTVSEFSDLTTQNVTISQKKSVTPQLPPPDYEIYFPNDIATLPTISDYENGLSGASVSDLIDYTSNPTGKGFGIGDYNGQFTQNTNGGYSVWHDRYNYGLNYKGKQISPFKVGDVEVYGALDPNLIPALQNYLNDKCTACKIVVSGYASKQGVPATNKILAETRAKNTIAFLKQQLFSNLSAEEANKRVVIGQTKEITNSGCVKRAGAPTDTLSCKKDRKATIHFEVDLDLLPESQVKPDEVVKVPLKRVNTKITNRFYNECNYFEQLTDSDPFVFDKFRDKIKYFHPAFHSTTPEGLNSRLTFLHQCTRQGPTLEEQGANNLAFGRAPVCILRIGDFYNTKIMIDNLSIDYEPIVWDLNPEGVGVQPMIANVNLSFKFIGGSTLMGPINKLQNALSFNYYANTQVYDPRADYIAKTSEISDSLKGKNIANTSNNFSLSLDGNYGLVKGVDDVNKEITVTKDTIIYNTPVISQTAANNTANGPNSPQQNNINTPQDDMDKIEFSYIKPIVGGLALFFNLTDYLSKDQTFRAYITDGKSTQRELCVGTLYTTDKSYTFSLIGPEYISGLVNNKSYTIIAKFGSYNFSTSFTYIKQ